jgi:hypothetical protein
MAITLGDIFNEINFFIKKENRFFASSDILRIINRTAFPRIAEELMYPKTVVSGFLSSGQYLISTPADFIKIDENSEMLFTDNTPTRNLLPTEKHEIGFAEILTATPGNPGKYYMESETLIGVYPPCTSGNYVIPYVKMPTGISSATDTNELTERCFMAAVYYTLSECMLTDNDEKAVFYNQKYDMEIKRLKDQYRLKFEITKDMKPHNKYVGPMGRT